MKKIILPIIFLASSSLSAKIPDYYQVTADDLPRDSAWEYFPRKYCQLITGSEESFKCPQILDGYTLSNEDKKAGIIVSEIGISEDLHSHYVLNKLPETCLNLQISRGEFRSRAFIVYALKEWKELRISCSDLTDSRNNRLAKDQIDLRYVSNTKIQTAPNQISCSPRYLLKRNSYTLPKGNTLWFWITFHAPEKIKAGEYLGKICIYDHQFPIKYLYIKLTVLDDKFIVPRGNWGMYLPGHLNRKSVAIYRNYAPKWWNTKNLDPFFKFCHTRNLNSFHLYLPYPDLRYENGKLSADFSELGKIISSARRNQISGKIIIDLRTLEFFAHAVKVLHQKKKIVVGYHGLYSNISGEKYDDFDRRIFSALLMRLRNETKKWGNVAFLPEEELASTRYVDKPTLYRAFVKPLLALVGRENVVLVDNRVGYPGTDIDTGKKDNIGIRQYNSWTEKALEDAKRDHAEIWAFNYGYDRFSYGLLNCRLQAVGNHQWADAFDFYQFALTDKGKVVSTLQYERMREGLSDLSVFSRLQKQKRPSLALNMLERVLNNIPVRRNLYMNWKGSVSDRDIDSLRKIAMRELIPRMKKTDRISSSPAICIIEKCWQSTSRHAASDAETSSFDSAKAVYFSPLHYRIDGKFDAVYDLSPRQRSLFWTRDREQYLRRASSCESDFKRFGPMWNTWRCGYSENGMILIFESNLGRNLIVRRRNGASDLWKDDCLELFWKNNLSGQKSQFIINMNNQSTFFENGVNKKHNIKSAVTIRNGRIKSCFIEIEVPWHYFGFNNMPLHGEGIDFNLGLENHSANQLIIWSQVHNKFGLANGRIIFIPTKESTIQIQKWSHGNSYRGMQQIELKVKSKKQLTAHLINAQGKTVFKKTLDNGNLFAPYFVPGIKNSQNWYLKLLDPAGKLLHDFCIHLDPEINGQSGIFITASPLIVFLGESFVIKTDVRIGNAEVKSMKFKIKLKCAETEKEYVFPEKFEFPRPGMNFISLRLYGLPQGHYGLSLINERTHLTTTEQNILLQ